ncbi:hypothetical protein [Pseudomonas sp. 35 E 8]|nr:hypothetical protein [Pseudomonas sp. 35 E 8]
MKLTSLSPVRPSLRWCSPDLQSMDKADRQLRSTYSLIMSTYVLPGRRDE